MNGTDMPVISYKNIKIELYTSIYSTLTASCNNSHYRIHITKLVRILILSSSIILYGSINVHTILNVKNSPQSNFSLT